jgi:HlyD family secretion protein
MDRKIEKKRWTPKRIFSLSGSVLVAFSILYFFVFADTSTKLNVDAERTSIATVRQDSFQEFIPVNGTIQPVKTIMVPAIEGGTVNRKYLEGGSMVEKGDTILKLDNNQLILEFMQRETLVFDLINNLQNTKLSLELNKFNLRRTLATLDFEIDAAKDLFDRNAMLYKDKVVSEQEYLNAKRDYERLVQQRQIEIESQEFETKNAKHQIAQLQETIARSSRNLKMMENNLNSLYITAPISGQLSAVQADLGAPITKGQLVGQIDDLDGFKVRASIDEHYISRIFAGLRGEFTFAGKTHLLEVTLVYPEVKNGVFQVDLKFLEKEPEGLRRGQTLQIRLQLSDAATAMLVPRGGFYQTTGGNWIFVVDPSGTFATKRKIRLGRQNPEYYEVLDGLQPGEKVLVSSYESYGDIDKLILKK